MVQDTIRAFYQRWDIAFSRHCKNSWKSWPVRVFSTEMTCIKQEFVFRKNVFLLHAMFWFNKVLEFLFYLFCVWLASPYLSALLTTSIHPDRCRMTPQEDILAGTSSVS